MAQSYHDIANKISKQIHESFSTINGQILKMALIGQELGEKNPVERIVSDDLDWCMETLKSVSTTLGEIKANLEEEWPTP